MFTWVLNTPLHTSCQSLKQNNHLKRCLLISTKENARGTREIYHRNNVTKHSKTKKVGISVIQILMYLNSA